MLKLLPLIVIALILFARSQKSNKTALFNCKTGMLSFNGYKRLFLLSTILSILLSIISNKLFLYKTNISFVCLEVSFIHLYRACITYNLRFKKTIFFFQQVAVPQYDCLSVRIYYSRHQIKLNSRKDIYFAQFFYQTRS